MAVTATMKQVVIQIQHSCDNADSDWAIEQVAQAVADKATGTASSFETQKGADFTNIFIQLETWNDIQPKLESLGLKMIVVCEGDFGWDDYRLLTHFDRSQKCDLPDDWT